MGAEKTDEQLFEEMKVIDFADYQRKVMRTGASNQKLPDKLALGGLGLSGEAGEVTDYLKKVLFHGKTMNVEHLKAELGDVLWYTAFLCETLELSMQDVATANIVKLKKRYPDKFVASSGLSGDVSERDE